MTTPSAYQTAKSSRSQPVIRNRPPPQLSGYGRSVAPPSYRRLPLRAGACLRPQPTPSGPPLLHLRADTGTSWLGPVTVTPPPPRPLYPQEVSPPPQTPTTET